MDIAEEVGTRIEARQVRPSDGRVARGLRTREAILDAYEALIQAAEVPPTAAELAARAGVSARSVFTHFADMDGVLAAAADRSMAWLVDTYAPIGPELPLAERIDRFAGRLAEVLERTSPLYRMFRTVRHGTRRDGGSPKVLEVLGDAEGIRSRYLRCVFEWELEAAGEGDDALFEAVMAGTSWGAWESLRFEQAFDVERARRVMHRLLEGLLR